MRNLLPLVFVGILTACTSEDGAGTGGDTTTDSPTAGGGTGAPSPQGGSGGAGGSGGGAVAGNAGAGGSTTSTTMAPPIPDGCAAIGENCWFPPNDASERCDKLFPGFPFPFACAPGTTIPRICENLSTASPGAGISCPDKEFADLVCCSGL